MRGSVRFDLRTENDNDCMNLESLMIGIGFDYSAQKNNHSKRKQHECI